MREGPTSDPDPLSIDNSTRIDSFSSGPHGVFIVFVRVREDLATYQAGGGLVAAELSVFERRVLSEIDREIGLCMARLPEHLFLVAFGDDETIGLHPLEFAFVVDVNGDYFSR